MKIKKNDLMRLWDIALEINAKIAAGNSADAKSLFYETTEIERDSEDFVTALYVAGAFRSISNIQPDLGYGDLLQFMKLLDVEVIE